MEKKITSHITKGLFIVLILALLDVVAGIWDFKLASWFRWIPTLVLFAAVIGSSIHYGSQNNYRVSFGDLFAYGFKTTAVVGCLLIFYTLLSIFVLFPETKEIALQQARSEMERDGKLTEEAINQGLSITRKFFVPFAIAGALFGTILVGALGSLVGAAVTRKNPVSPFETNTK
ncbi:MAG: DUF4199 domain-containing protein [Puia sp.]|nr:DUF4199 domain-containing protein [Puia sp.]